MTDKENATVIGNRTKSVTSARESIQSLDFASVWSGDAYNSMIPRLNAKTNELKLVEDDITLFREALTELDRYKELKQKIESLSNELSSLSNTKENEGRISALQAEISTLTREKEELKTSINNKITSICGTEITKSDTSIVDAVEDATKEFDYIVDINNLEQVLKHSRIIGANENLYNYYDRSYIYGVLQNVQNKYTGREAAVNSVLAVLELCAQKGIRLNYEHSGTVSTQPYVATDYIANGVDCNPFVSWCVDKGTPGGFQWRPVENFLGVGNNIDYSYGQPGDVLVASNDAAHHVMFVVKNDTANKRVTIAHASGQVNGIYMSTASYNELASQGYSMRDMTQVYQGTENTNRDIFNQYVDWNSYSRPV